MGGVGKSQLAADYARTALAERAVDVVVWVTATVAFFADARVRHYVPVLAFKRASGQLSERSGILGERGGEA